MPSRAVFFNGPGTVRLRRAGMRDCLGLSSGIFTVALVAAFDRPAMAQDWGGHMMGGSGMGGAMWGGMGIVWLILIVLAVLGAIALMKYLFRG